MRHPDARDRTAATFFGLAAGVAMLAAIATSSVILVAVAAVMVVAAFAAAHRYPVDPLW